MNLEQIFTIILIVIFGSIVWFLFGLLICPNNIKVHWQRALVLVFWPVIIILAFLSIPFVALYELSKP